MRMVLPALKQRHVDSLNHIPMPLSLIPKTFGFEEEVKGYFPHTLNSVDNIGKILPFPSIEAYQPERMKPAARIKFLKWYEEQDKEQGFDYDAEVSRYCFNDVSILRRGVYKYRQIFREVTKTTRSALKDKAEVEETFEVDPFSYTTIASSCQAVFKSKFLEDDVTLVTKDEKRDSIAEGRTPQWVFGHHSPGGELRVDGQLVEVAVNDKGKTPMLKVIKSDIARPANEEIYIRKNTYSRQSICWLNWMAKTKGVTITHALNGTEMSVTNPNTGRAYLLDGYSVDSDGKVTAYEFDGCLWHGCPKCFPNQEIDAKKAPLLLSQRNTMTEVKNRFLVDKFDGRVEIIRGCEWTDRIKNDQTVRDFVAKEEQNIAPRLSARGTFYGGRTEVFTTLKSEGEMYYYDFTSLYPDVNKVI